MDGMKGQPDPGPDLGPANWSRRYKANLERLDSGDRHLIAEVVRQLAARELMTGITSGEKRMLARARPMLDDLDDGSAGVREPRRPFPPDSSMGVRSRTTPGTISRLLG
jgi:hypothetical protein